MSGDFSRQVAAHRLRSLAEAVERETLPPSGDDQLDVEIGTLRHWFVARLRSAADTREARS